MERLEEAKKLLLRLGTRNFGQPSAAVQTIIESMNDLSRLEIFFDRWLAASGWDELLAIP